MCPTFGQIQQRKKEEFRWAKKRKSQQRKSAGFIKGFSASPF